MRLIGVLLGFLWLAAGSGLANIVQATGLSTNADGQVTAHYFPGDPILPFDLFVDILNADGSSRCQPIDPCFPINSSGTSLKSRQFDSGQFQVLFQAMMNGSPLIVDGAGLNQK